MKFINIGFGNLVNPDKVYAIVNPDAAPIRRLITTAKDAGTLIDASQGRKTKSVLVLEDGRILLSALQSDTIGKRMNQSADEREEGNE